MPTRMRWIVGLAILFTFGDANAQTTAAKREKFYLVEQVARDGASTLAIMSAAEVKSTQATIKDEEKIRPKLLDATAKAWNEDLTLKGKSFPRAAIDLPSLSLKGEFSDREKADQAERTATDKAIQQERKSKEREAARLKGLKKEDKAREEKREKDQVEKRKIVAKAIALYEMKLGEFQSPPAPTDGPGTPE